MRYDLYKILDEKHVGDFIAGRLYMNSLNYFRGVEGNTAQGDPLEGVCGTISRDRLRQFGLNFDDGLADAIIGGVSLISEYYGLNNLLCLYRLAVDDRQRIIQRPSEALRGFNDADSQGKMVVRICDTDEFLRRVSTALESAVREHWLEYAVFGPVSYSNAWSSVDGPGTRSAFHKGPEYEYQREWRLCVLRPALKDEPFTLDIGDLSDITETLSLEQLISQPELIYPGYTAVERVDMPDGGYRMFGSRNAVSKLMYSYIAPQQPMPKRSDMAEAAHHYAEFLRLSGRADEIDAYLEARMHEAPDLDHLELLVDHRLSVGQWVRATDAFAFYLDNAPEAIVSAPERFFFSLHTILMEHHEPADAGKLLLIAGTRYSLPEETMKVMLSDVLFALGFYDKVAPLFEQMQAHSADPIIEYYLAVTYLHLLKFDLARSHAESYGRYFAHSPDYAHKAAKLCELLDVFTSAPPKPAAAEAAPALLDGMTGAREKRVYLGLEALYALERSQSWDALDKFEGVTVCPLLISDIMQLYSETGDGTLRRIIYRLASLPTLELRSPALDAYLAVDTEMRDAPPAVKMHRAFFNSPWGTCGYVYCRCPVTRLPTKP